MRAFLLAASILMLPVFAVPQVKHAPTFQSCAADLNLWTSQIPGWPNPNPEQLREGLKPLTFNDLGARISSIRDCTGAYPILTRAKHDELSATSSLTMFYGDEMAERYFDFLDRHNLIVKFMQEDEAGKR